MDEAVVRVLLPRYLRRFTSHCSGHRVLHYVGDPTGLTTHGVGVLITEPFGRVPEAPAMSEAEYVVMGDWVAYVSPNRLTTPYVFAALNAVAARALGHRYAKRAEAFYDRIRESDVRRYRSRMPFNACARCDEPTGMFLVSDEQWARVGAEWRDEVLCEPCYGEVVGDSGSAV